MLVSLTIRDMMLIERLTLDFADGLNVLTGETGAGKSILLDSLGFALGWRTRADLVRPGADQGEVTAVFEVPAGHPAVAILDDGGFDFEGEIILRRTITADGRRQAYVNDRRCSVDLARRLGAALVELHGQGDDGALLNPRGHRALLDAHGGLAEERAAVADAWRRLAQARAALARAEADAEAAARDEDYLRHAVAELQDFAPQPGEDAELDARRRLMKAAEAIRADIARADAAMGREGAEAMLADALHWLEGAAARADAPLDAPIAALGRALNELAEAQAGLADAVAALDGDPGALEAVEDRLFGLRGLARKHGVAPDDLADLAGELAARLDALEAGGARIDALAAEVAAAQAAYDAAAAALSAARAKAARSLEGAIAAELPPLRLDKARFTVAIAPTDPGPEGTDAVTFTATTNPGVPPGPLNRIASGGELSRFLLALKVAIAGAEAGQTMIFDEIDRGVGGATADAVGRRLRKLAEGAQVLVVTHSPQVAAQGQHHWRVSKSEAKGVTRSTVEPLTGEARTDELARMLAGDTVTDAARAAARALLPA